MKQLEGFSFTFKRYICTHMTTVFSHQDQIRAVTSHKPSGQLGAGYWARVHKLHFQGWTVQAGTSLCLSSLCFAAKRGTWARLLSFVCFKPEAAVCKLGLG